MVGEGVCRDFFHACKEERWVGQRAMWEVWLFCAGGGRWRGEHPAGRLQQPCSVVRGFEGKGKFCPVQFNQS